MEIWKNWKFGKMENYRNGNWKNETVVKWK